MRCRQSKHTSHDSNLLADSCLLDEKCERLDDDTGVVDVVPMASIFVLTPYCCPKELVLVSDDIITFIVEPRVCNVGLRLWFLLLTVFCRGLSLVFSF